MADASFKPSRVDKNYPNRRWEEKVGRALENHLRYSTSETATGELWIDGSPIKRIVVDTGGLPDTSSTTTSHGVTFTNIIRIFGAAKRSTNNRWLPLPYVDTTTSTLVELSITDTDVEIYTATNLSVYTSSYVVFEYV